MDKEDILLDGGRTKCLYNPFNIFSCCLLKKAKKSSLSNGSCGFFFFFFSVSVIDSLFLFQAQMVECSIPDGCSHHHKLRLFPDVLIDVTVGESSFSEATDSVMTQTCFKCL